MLAGETRSLVEQHLFRAVACERRRRTLIEGPPNGGPTAEGHTRLTHREVGT